MESKNNVWAIALAIIITTVVVGGGVYWWKQSQVVQEEVVVTDTIDTTTADKEEPKTEDRDNIYEWETQSITFNYPNGYNVLERTDGSLLITTATEIPDGDVSTFATLLEIISDTSLEERIAKYSTEETFSQETKVIGGHEFTKISLYANFGGFDYARYLLGFDGKVLDYKVGKNEADLALEMLESIQF